MGQFHAYDNPNKLGRKSYPYLLEIQSNLIADSNSTIVIPLAPLKALQVPISRLNPIVKINGNEFVIVTQQISAYERKRLAKPQVDLSPYRNEIVAAIDFVISGF